MRRTAFIALSLAALTAAVAAGAPAPSTARTRSHRRIERTAVSRHSSSNRTPAHRASSYRTTAHRFSTPERRVSYQPDRSRLAAERHERYEAVERHERDQAELRARDEAEHRSRYVDELSARYEEGYNAGYTAGLAAARSRLAAQSDSPAAAVRRPAPADPSAALAARLDSHASAHPSAASAYEASSPLDAGETDTANLAPVLPVTPSAPGEQAPYTVESATYDTMPGTGQAFHHPPVTMEASLVMLREPPLPPLRGTLASLERQNRRLDAEGLARIQNDSDLERRIAERLLVPLPVSEGLIVNPSLPTLRRYCRPWTAEFLADLARIHDAIFHRPLQVDSAVRPVSYQRQLMRVNGNAAPAEGEIASPHETGASVDIAKRGMTLREIGWMRRYLLTLQNANLIDVEEEFEQACFHITVYENYAPARPLRRAARPSRRAADADTVSFAEDAPGR